jgi:hypothetical protein
MNVYQRPLFRQAGGPVAQMQPQMAAPEVAVGQAEAEASAGMERVGIDYLAQTMGGIDAATDAKGLIDALRGNSKPIEARYAELAQFVGEQDARQTPESVLALVQPTLMMTEQGAVDSGIGELMQNIVGQVEMETEGGAPTPMAGGVGSLMMAGAPQAEVGQPPVQNFRNGGLVQRFQVGGEAQGRLGQIYSEMLPVYQSVLGPGGSEEAKAQALFAIAQAAGQFAAGRGPQGEDLRGASPAAAFAANLGGLSGSLQQQAAARAQEERALRLAALQGAQQEYSAERAAARAASGRERGIGEAYEAVDAEGNVIAMEFLVDRAGLEAFQAANPGATIRKAAPTREPVLKEVDGALYDVTDPNNPRLVIGSQAGLVTLYNPQNNQTLPNVPVGSDAYNRALVAGYVDLETAEKLQGLSGAGGRSGEFIKFEMPDGTVETVRSDDPRADELVRQGGIRVSIGQAQTPDMFVNVELFNRYGAGLTTPEEDAVVQSEIANAAVSTFNPATGQMEQAALPRIVRDAETQRALQGLPTQINIPLAPEPPETSELQLALQESGNLAFGTTAMMKELFNTGVGVFNFDAPAEVTQRAIANVDILNTAAETTFKALSLGKANADEIALFRSRLPSVASPTTSPSRAAAQIEALIRYFEQLSQNAQEQIDTGIAGPGDALNLRRAMIESDAIVKSYRSLLTGLGGAVRDQRIEELRNMGTPGSTPVMIPEDLR